MQVPLEHADKGNTSDRWVLQAGRLQLAVLGMVTQVLVSEQAVLGVGERAGEIPQRLDNDRVGVGERAECADRLDEVVPLDQDAADAGPLGNGS